MITPCQAFLEMLDRAKVDHDETRKSAQQPSTTQAAAPSCLIVVVGETEFHFDQEGELRFVFDGKSGEVLSHTCVADPCDRLT